MKVLTNRSSHVASNRCLRSRSPASATLAASLPAVVALPCRVRLDFVRSIGLKSSGSLEVKGGTVVEGGSVFLSLSKGRDAPAVDLHHFITIIKVVTYVVDIILF
ncbi:uncharacterized protein LOC120080992 [Benincasa hispida]|uniref:uncharacterized protein LOC120080992 n=1 Tax=Benincasa hispida TaxID=102211 RepID=UPI001900B946|nr:uncharacterized protein LOC120080992 [Benincasa hispida]